MPESKQPGRKPASSPAEDKPLLQLEGRHQKTSLTLDAGLWNCVLDTAHFLTKRMRAMGRRRVTIVKVIEAAFIAFHELPVEKQIELVSKHE